MIPSLSAAPIRNRCPRHRLRRARRACAVLCRDERGATTAELVVIMPLLLTLILAIAQYALWAHATHIAQAAAANALAAARAQGGTAQTGQVEARQVLDQFGNGPLRDPRVVVYRDATSAAATVTGTATTVLPFLTLPVHAEATGPAELFRPAPRELASPGAAGTRRGGAGR